MGIPLNKSQTFTILRSCHYEAYYNHTENRDYYSMVEDYLRDWDKGEQPEIIEKWTPLKGKLPKLNDKEERIYHIVRKLTGTSLTNDFTVLGTDFTEEEIATIIELLNQYSDDIDVVVVMGLDHDYNTLNGWINESTLCDRTFEILPDEGYLNLKSSEIRDYFVGECYKADWLVKHIRSNLS